MHGHVLQRKAAWTEDRATQRCDPSADPGAKTEGRAVCNLTAAAARPSTLRDWHESDKPSRHDAATLPAGCPPQFANADRQEFQFPLNQDTAARCGRTKWAETEVDRLIERGTSTGREQFLRVLISEQRRQA